MVLMLKRALVVPIVAAAAVAPALAGHPAAVLARAATTRATATTRAAVVTAQAAAAAPAASTAPAAAAAPAAVVTAQVTTAARSHHSSRRWRAYLWAARQRGKPYCWGGTGGCFDCSGLVMAAYRHEGIYFGRDTAEMLASPRLVRVSRRRARMGYLAFYGSGHVELVAGRRYTLGALKPGTRVGWHRRSRWWHPTMYFRVKDAG